MMCYWIGPFGMDPEHSGYSGFTRDFYGWKIQVQIAHDSHISQKIIFAWKNCIGIKIRYILIQTSVSCVKIVLLKGKVEANFKVFRCSRSFQSRFYQSGKAWISWSGFSNMVSVPRPWSTFDENNAIAVQNYAIFCQKLTHRTFPKFNPRLYGENLKYCWYQKCASKLGENRPDQRIFCKVSKKLKNA